jgi:Glycosyltransferase 61
MIQTNNKLVEVLERLAASSEKKEELLLRQIELLEKLLVEQNAAFTEAPGSVEPPPLTPTWLPQVKNAMPLATESLSGRLVSVSANKDVSISSLDRLKQSWFGRVYLTKIKKIGPIHRLAIWVWRTGYPVYMNQIVLRFTALESKKWQTLVPLNAYLQTREVIKKPVFDFKTLLRLDPSFLPKRSPEQLGKPTERLEFPPVFVVELENTICTGGSNIVEARDSLICHDLFNPTSDYTSEELHGRLVVNSDQNKARWLVVDRHPSEVEIASSFLDACAPNYAHWTTEILPKIAVFCALKEYEDVPILIDANLHPNILQSVAACVGEARTVIQVPQSRRVSVAKLITLSVCGYVPFEPRNKKVLGTSQGVFRPEALSQIPKIIANRIPSSSREIKWPKKVFLRRTALARQAINAPAIEDYLVSIGFKVIEPERLDFYQQVCMFQNVDVIVGVTGAAFANVIYCRPETKVCILIGELYGTSYWYWAGIAQTNDIKISYVLGKIPDDSMGIHSNFEIQIADLTSALDIA